MIYATCMKLMSYNEIGFFFGNQRDLMDWVRVFSFLAKNLMGLTYVTLR